MGDYIKRSDVIRTMEECHLDKQLFEKEVFDKINELPTAYNEKVIEELEKLSLEAKTKAANLFCEADYLTNRTKQIAKQSNDMLAFAYDKAIEIVKAGGSNG